MHFKLLDCRAPRALTLVELLVVFVVISMLAALMLYGVQAARQTARVVQCQSNLRQIGIAVASYSNTFRVFPPGATSFGNNLHVSILPFMEQPHLYELFMTRYAVGNYGFPETSPSISTYVCSSDPAPFTSAPLVGTNYAGNSGVWLLRRMDWDGIIVPWMQMSSERIDIVRPADVLDGLTNTSMVSEVVRADGSMHRRRTAWHMASTFSNIDVFAEACRSIPEHPESAGWTGDPFALGTSWASASVTATLYNHVLTPNQPTCFNGGGVPEAAASAGSFHSGGVNTLFADGSIHFIGNSVVASVWRQMASRADSVNGP